MMAPAFSPPFVRRLAIGLTLSTLAGPGHALTLVEWDIPINTATTALTTSVEPGLSASPISSTGLGILSASTLWRTYGYNDTEAKGVAFSITASPGSTVTLESLVFTANAQAGSAGAWTNPRLTLEYSTDPDFASVTEAGTLALGPDLANQTGAAFTADSTTFFGTDLVIQPGETYHFRLVGLGASAATGNANRLSYNSAADMQLNGTVVSSSADLVWAGADGANWNTSEPNFTKDGSPASFATNDNVTIATPGAIKLDAAGITAGILTDTTASGTVTLQTGDLTVTGLTKSGGGTLAIAGPVTLDTGLGPTSISGGTLQVLNGAALTTSSLALAGGATLRVDLGGTLTSSGNNTLDAGGATLQTEEPVSLGPLTSGVVGVPFIKSGSGILTLTGALGVQTSGPVDLDILGGSVVASGSNQLNLGGTLTWNGDLVLDGARLELHGATVSGTGSIIARSGNATIDSRFQGGAVNVDNAIVLESDLTVDAPTGDSQNNLHGPITGAGNLVKVGNGVVVLDGANAYLGTTTVNAGVLRIGRGAGSTSGQLGAGAVTLNVTSSTGTLEFRRDDAVVVPNLISGAGDVTVVGGPASTTTLTAANDYTGVTTVRGGTLVATTISDYDQPGSIGAAPLAGSLQPEQYLQIRNGGILSYTGPAASTDREFTLGTGGGTISADGTGPLTFTSTFTIGSNGTSTNLQVLTLGGSAPGTSSIAMQIPDGDGDGTDPAPRGIIKTGTTTWALTNTANTYTGPTSVEQGTLSLAGDFLDDLSTVSIASGAILDLPHGAGDTVDTLFLDGVQVAAGTYGSSAVTAVTLDVVDDTHFSGNGYLVVTTDPPVNDYDTWAGVDGFNLSGGPADDDDGDGVSNEDEYAFGLNPTDPASADPIRMPLSKATGMFTYTRRNRELYDTGLTYTYGSSTTLQDFPPFTPVSESTDGGDPVERITVTVPASLLESDRRFVRVTAE